MKKLGAEKNLLLLSAVALGLFVTLVVTLFGVQALLRRNIDHLESTTLPTEQSLHRLEASVGAIFRRQAEMTSTANAQQLTAIDATATTLDEDLRGAHRALAARLGAEGSRVEAATIDAMAAHIDDFNGSDRALHDTILRRHELRTKFAGELASVDGALTRAALDARSISGRVRLDYMVLLRRIRQGLDQGGAQQDLVREAIMGDARAQQDAVVELVSSILSLRTLTAKIGLVENEDDLNSLLSNEVLQALALVDHRSKDVDRLLAKDADLAQKSSALREKIGGVRAQILDESRDSSLVYLRRRVFAEERRAGEIRAAAVAHAGKLSTDIQAVSAYVATMAETSKRASARTLLVTRFGSLLVALAGVILCAFSAGRVHTTIRDLSRTNKNLAELKDELSAMNDDLEHKVEDRTRSLAERERSMRTILDSTGDGLLTVDLEGTIVGERSKAIVTWFGEPSETAPHLWDYLLPHDDVRRKQFRGAFAQLAEDILPFELNADQMPRRLARAGATYELDYKQILDETGFVKVLVLVRDVTVAVAGEAAEKEAREQQAVVANFLRDRNGFSTFVHEVNEILADVRVENDPVVLKRLIHTLKGNSAIYGVESLASCCHEIESRLAEEPALAAADRDRLDALWHARLRRISEFFTPDKPGSVEIQLTEHERLLTWLSTGRDRDTLRALVESWRWERTSEHLTRLGAQARRIATSLSKSIDVSIVDDGLRLPSSDLAPFWPMLIHVIRNAVDHGIEDAAERTANGKSALGHVRLSSRIDGQGRLVVEIADDGRGVDVEALLRAARERGASLREGADPLNAMFIDGVSTRTVVTGTSGRGIGMAAVRAACEKAGGTIAVETEKGKSTTFRFTFPARFVQRPVVSLPPAAMPSMRAAFAPNA